MHSQTRVTSETWSIKRDHRSFDFILAFFVIALVVFGIFMVGSAEHIDTEGFSRLFKMHMVWAITGIAIMLVVAFVDFTFISRFYVVLYVLNLLLLILVLFIGNSTNDTARWIYLSDLGIRGFDFGIQPSEFTKIFMIIYMAKFIDKCRERIDSLLILGLIVLAGLVPIILIAVQPSLSAAVATGMVLITLLFAAKIRWKYILIALAVVLPLLIFFFYDLNNENQLILDKILKPYQQNRIRVWIDPTIDPDLWFQSQRSIDAIRSGQLTGRGLFGNVVAVPYSTNDFIFAVIGAEFGFVGCIGVIAAIIIVVIRCFMIAFRTDIFMGRLIAAATGSMIAFQAIINVSVATGTLPNTGITLPFISSGGSSIWITMAAVGLVLSVGMSRAKSMFED